MPVNITLKSIGRGSIGRWGASYHALFDLRRRQLTLLLTTEMHNLSFDLVAANPADLKLYQANLSELQRLRTGFTHLCGDPDLAFAIDDATDEADEEAEGHIGILSEQCFEGSGAE